MTVFDGLNGFLLLIGIYLLVLAMQMKRSGKVPAALLAEEELKKIKDEEALVKELIMPMLLLAIIMMADGVTGEVFLRIYPISWFRFIQLCLFLAAWMYFMKKYQDAKAQHIAV